MKTPLAAFGALSFAYFAAIGLFNPYSPLWLQSLGFSTLAIGGIASLQSWTRIVVPYAWSWLGDHSGDRVLLLRLAALGTLLCSLALIWSRDYVAVSAVVICLFAMNGGVIPLSEAAVVRHLSSANSFDAGRYGRVRVWGSLGFIVAVTLGGAVLEQSGVQWFPLAVMLLSVGLLAAAWRLPRAREAVAKDEPPPPAMPVLRQPAVLLFFASVAFTVLAHTSLYAFFSLYLEAHDYGKTQIGLFWALSVICEVAFFWWQGSWFHKVSPWRWLQVASAVTALRFAVLAMAGGWLPALLLTQASHALTFAAHHAAAIALVHRHFPDRLRGRGQALYTTLGYGFPGVLGGVGGGWVLQHHSYATLFWLASAAGGAAWLCAALGQRRDSARATDS